MSNAISVATVIEANRLDSDVPFLCLAEIQVMSPTTATVAEIVRIVRNTESVTFGGELYEASSFDVEIKHASGQSSEVTLSAYDYTKTLVALLEQYEGGVGSIVTLTIVSAGALDGPPEFQEEFLVTSASAADYKVSLTLGAESALARTFPPRRQTRDFCQWRFKDPATCRYSGLETTCDLTLKGPNGCAARGNTINFGGFPGINTNGQRYA
jgi:phage-related protein